jgi:hypothetical protein
VSRHDLDVSSLFAGLLLLAVGAGYLIADATDVSIDGRWVLPVLLIALGLTGLAGSVMRRPRRRSAKVSGPAPAEPELEPEAAADREPVTRQQPTTDDTPAA